MVHDGSPGAEGSLAGFERALSARLADLLCDCATATPAVSLFRLWPRLAAEQLDLAAALRHLADDKHLRLAREWAGSLDVKYQACQPYPALEHAGRALGVDVLASISNAEHT